MKSVNNAIIEDSDAIYTIRLSLMGMAELCRSRLIA